MTRFHRAAAVPALALSTLGMVTVSANAFPLFAEEKVNPKVIKKTPPAYPPDAKEARIQGTVVLAIRIGTDGFVSHIELVSGHPLLVGAAVDSVKTWEFEPGRKNGVAVEVVTTIEINFTLSD